MAELNLNALHIIGSGCPRLQRLTIAYCHYNVEQNDRRRMEAAVEAARSTKPASDDDGNGDNILPFQQLKSATFLLSSSTQLPLLKYPVVYARRLQELTIRQMYQPLEDSFLTSLLTWNPMAHLERFQLTKGMDDG